MNCDYKYEHILTDKERIMIALMIKRNVPMRTICEKFGLTKQFIKYIEYKLLKSNVPVFLGYKNESYYQDEMMYGKLNLKYEDDNKF
jgi:hypothetical protein